MWASVESIWGLALIASGAPGSQAQGKEISQLAYAFYFKNFTTLSHQTHNMPLAFSYRCYGQTGGWEQDSAGPF